MRGLAHHLKPAAFIGQKGLTRALLKEIESSLEASELIKIKFLDYKEKKVKTALVQEIEDATGAQLAGLIGHVAIYYREHKDPEKRRITIP